MILMDSLLAYVVSFLHLCSINIALNIKINIELMEKYEKMVFRDHYDKLTDAQKDIVRRRVLEESGMAYATFYYKLRTNSFKPLEMKLITEIINSLNN